MNRCIADERWSERRGFATLFPQTQTGTRYTVEWSGAGAAAAAAAAWLSID